MNRYLVALITASVLAGIVAAWAVLAFGIQVIGMTLGAILHLILTLIPGGRP